ncbi:hypothetical protein CYMTET_14108, partial [Cymbomonas tetramitiformis]
MSPLSPVPQVDQVDEFKEDVHAPAKAEDQGSGSPVSEGPLRDEDAADNVPSNEPGAPSSSEESAPGQASAKRMSHSNLVSALQESLEGHQQTRASRKTTRAPPVTGVKPYVTKRSLALGKLSLKDKFDT